MCVLIVTTAKIGDPHPGLEGCMELKTNKIIENEKQEAILHKWVELLAMLALLTIL